MSTNTDTETTTAAPPRLVHRIYIRTTAERLFQALTDGELTRRYYMGTRVESDWTAGAAYAYRTPDGRSMLDGEVVEIDPPRRLVMTFQPRWVPESGVSRVTFEIEEAGESCRLTVVHEGIEPALTGGIEDGWERILSSLKSLLETDRAIVFPAG